MLRFRALTNAKAALAYYGKSDGGYYLDGSDLRREVGGKLASILGLSTEPDPEQFARLLNGLDPHTGEQLTAKLVDGRLAGWDLTASVPKGVTVALERGDTRIHDALWETVRETMADLEGYVTTRERVGGKQDNRVTGNLVWHGFEHPETRPAKEDGMPDMDRHVHIVVSNLTYDAAEDKFKAIKFRPIMDMRKFFDRSFDMRLASKLTDLGYQVETKYKADEKGGKKYFSWDIKGMPQSVVKKFSRRADEVEVIAAKLGIENPVSKDKLGATSRMFKRKDMTLADYRAYWASRITPEENKQISKAILEAMSGRHGKPDPQVSQAVGYALGHHFERRSVVDWKDVAVTAMERGMGSALPEQILPEARKQGLLLKEGEATTRQVLAEEGRVIGFARDGRGTCGRMGARPGSQVEAGAPLKLGRDEKPLSQGDTVPLGALGSGVGGKTVIASSLVQPISATDNDVGHKLSPEQAAIARHVWESPDRVILIRGAAGTGKTHTMKATIAGIDRPVVVLAPSAEASRGVLRNEGFQDADTVARFLIDEKFQETAKNGVIWVDEAGLLGIRQVREVFDAAERLNARVVLQGDKKQHGSVERGATLRVLEEFAGLPVAELRDIRRQKGRYKDAVASLAKGDVLDGYDKLDDLGWVRQISGNGALVDDYMAALGSKKAKQADADRVIVVAPTHVEGDEITAEIRERLKEQGIVSKDEMVVETLRPLGWTEAERGDVERYDGTEILQWHRNSGTFKAGDRIGVADFKTGQSLGRPQHFSVYARTDIGLAAGDQIRITANGKTADGKHKLNNGATYRVTGVDDDGKIALTNGWTIGSDFKHISHGYVTTSHASQGKTVDRVLIAMGSESRPAVSAEQFYVSVSRGRDQATIYSDMKPAELREAIQRSDTRKSATELLGAVRAKAKPKSRLRKLAEKTRAAFKQLRDKAADAIGAQREKERGYAR